MGIPAASPSSRSIGLSATCFLIFLFLLLAAVSFRSAGYDYDPDSAVLYARDYCDKKNPGDPGEGYYFYEGKDVSDCANFVSQCLRAGGLTSRFEAYGQQHPGALDPWGCITSCTTLHRFLADYLRVTTATLARPAAGGAPTPPTWFGPGDVVIFHYADSAAVFRTSPPVKHSVFATGSTGSTTTCCGHAAYACDLTVGKLLQSGDRHWASVGSPSWKYCTYYDVAAAPDAVRSGVSQKPAQTPLIEVLSPNGGEQIPIGAQPAPEIRWRLLGTAGQVKIQLSTDGASSWVTLLPSTPNDGTEKWDWSWCPWDSARVDWGKWRRLSSRARIRVTSVANPGISDVSDADFTLSCGGELSPGNPYYCCGCGGNCTWWAWEAVRSDTGVSLPNWGNAKDWAAAAVKSGYKVGDVPEEGTIAVRTKTTAEGPYGHVAWVVGISNNSVTVNEMNCDSRFPAGVRQHAYSRSFFQKYIHVQAAPATSAPLPRPTSGIPTAAVLVMDVSGSMGWSWQGGVKIESAKQAALSFLELVRQEAAATGVDHRVAVVGFSTSVYTFLPLTNDFDKARSTIISLGPTDSTNLGAGIQAGLSELRKLGGTAKRFMILLSDGMTNTGLNQDQILAGPVAQARDQRICINTVGFGDPGDIDDGFLQRIAALSGCGTYYYAATGLQLFGAFAQIRHAALGQVIPALSSYGKQVTVSPGASVALGTFYLPGNQDELYMTLGWSGQGSLKLQLEDPTGTSITSTYAGAHLYTGQHFAQAIIDSPKSGFWKVNALPTSTAPAKVEYFSVGSTRPGGVAFSLPLPVVTVAGQTFALPGGLPTPLLVLISLAAIALAVWNQINPQ